MTNPSDSKFNKTMHSDREQLAGEYPSLNVLLLYLSEREKYRPVIFSPNEIFASPDCKTEVEGDRLRTIQTPVGEYDIAPILEQIGRSQQPDLLIVQADATRRNLPTNLDRLNCPKLLLLGKTNYFDAPIQTTLHYACEQKFDLVISEQQRHHLHYFKEAGFPNVLWIPGFNVNPYPQPPDRTPHYPLTFIGEVGKFARYRKYIRAWSDRLGVAVNHSDNSPEDAAKVYAESAINLNVSLNGELNLRLFEVLASGGFLLTDRLSPQAGLELLFEDGKHLATFRNESELSYKLSFFLDNPESTREIAQNAYEQFWRNHRPELNVQRILDCANGEAIAPIYQIETEKRSIYFSRQNGEKLHHRISLYEYLQELHRTHPNLKGLFWPKVDPRIIGDAVDLPRLAISLMWDSHADWVASRALLAQCEIEEQITFTSNSQQANQSQAWDFIALTWAELQTQDIDRLLTTVNFGRAIVTDAPSQVSAEEQKVLDELLERRGFVKDSECPIVYHWQRKADWGKYLLSQQHFIEAVRAFELALQDNPWDVTALVELGTIAVQLNHFHEAERLFRKAVRCDRRNPLAMEQLARVLIALNQHQDAANILEHLSIIKPRDPSVWSLLENCYQQTGLERKALEAYRYSRELRDGKSLGDTSMGALSNSTAKTAAKRILVINNLYPPQELGGYGRRICDFANVLRDRGHSIQVLTSDAPYLKEIQSREENIDRSLLLCGTYEQLPPEPFEDKAEIARILDHNDRVIREAIENYTPDVCLVGNIDLLSHQVFDPMLEHWIPVMHLLGFPKTGYYPSHTPRSPLYHVGANSEFSKQSVLEQGYPLEDVSVVYPGAFVRQFQMCALPNLDKLRIVFAGLVLPYKGPQTLVEALGILHDADVDFHCAIAGDAPVENVLEEIRNFAEARGMADKIDFLGYLPRPQLIDIFAKYNVLVFPSIWEEPFGRVQVEAMAAGLTAITSATGGSAEIIEPGISGLTFPAEDAPALAEALMSLIRDRDRWQCMAAAGQQRAEQFDIQRSVDFIETKFDELLQQRDRNEAFREFQLLKLQAELVENLNLKAVNLVIFPDWLQPEESLTLQLNEAIAALATHPDRTLITLLIDTRGISEENAELAISSVVMNLLMEEEIDVSEGPEISPIGQLSDMQWSALLPLLSSRLMLENENQAAIAAASAENLPPCNIDQLRNMRAVAPNSGDNS